MDLTNPDAQPEAALVHLNSPGNPDGHVMSSDELRAAVAWAFTVPSSSPDECYAALPWEPYVSEGVPLLDTEVCEGDERPPRPVLCPREVESRGLPRCPHLRRSCLSPRS